MADPETQAFRLAILEAYGASQSAIGASYTVTANTGNTASLLHDEPPRPSRDVSDIFPGLLPFVARNQWLEKRNQELLNEKPDSDQKRIAAEKKLAAITLEMKETLIAFESRTMALKKCEEEKEKWPVQELWLSTQEERVKAEVKKQTEIEVRKTVEPHIRAECAKAQEEGCKAGYVAGVYDGVKNGHLEGQVYAATIWRERVTSAEKASRNNSYTAGRVQGYADGRREGYNVGISAGFTIGLAAGKREGAGERGETNQQSYERGWDEGHSQGHYEGYAKGFAQGLDAVEQEEGGTA
ncbi:hypothetical protein AA0112_g6508 [Alternaria arborescens]|nr:hypothetical protein AA0112_g6508 [Alternaria arborescens]